jgi:hypothetical protein
VAEYAPYDAMPEFQEGFAARRERRYRNPYQGVPAQAWDRGLDAAARYASGADPRRLKSEPAAEPGWLGRLTK